MTEIGYLVHKDVEKFDNIQKNLDIAKNYIEKANKNLVQSKK